MLVTSLAFLLANRVGVPIAEVNFELFHGHIYFPAEVNGQKTTAVLDSGAGSTVMDLAYANELKLSSQGEIAVGGIGNARVPGKLLSDAKVSFGGYQVPIRIAIPLRPMAVREGRRMEVIVGYEFFRSHIVQIDYPHHQLRIYEPDAKFDSSGTSVPIHLVGNLVHVTTDLTIAGTKYPMETVIDTGAGVDGGLSSRFTSSHPINVPMTPKSVIGGGVGGMISGTLFRPDSLGFGGAVLAKPVFSMTDSAGGASGANSSYDLLLGSGILRRFTVTFDYQGHRMILKPGEDLNMPFEADKAGIRFECVDETLHSFRVLSVLDGSTAFRAGIKQGDVIESIDAKPAAGMTLNDLSETFRSATATGWDLELRRADQRIKIHVDARTII
jgi:hypothetical protein